MTKYAKRVLKSIGVPSVAWSDAFGQYYVRIGYSRSASGIRQRKFHYLGKVESDAIGKAAALKSQWRLLKATHGKLTVWGDAQYAIAAPMTVAQENAAIEKLHDEQTDAAIESGQVEWQSARFSIEQVAEQYATYRKSKGTVNAATLKNDERNLTAAVVAYQPTRIINGLGYAEIEQWRDSLLRRQRGGEISKRTFNNYWGEVKRLLDWSHREKSIGYRHADDVKRLFADKLKNATP